MRCSAWATRSGPWCPPCRHLMDDIIEQEGQKRRSELEVLQSQINPHFLYNTLDSVIWMTEAGRYERPSKWFTSLARLFRISLSRGKSITPWRTSWSTPATI